MTMETIAIISGVAALVQLIEVALKTSRTLSRLLQDTQILAEEIRRSQLTIYCVESKLEVLKIDLAGLPADCVILRSLLGAFRSTITEIQKDLENVTRYVKACDPGQCEAYSTKQRLQRLLCNKKAIARYVSNLADSEANLGRLEQTLQVCVCPQ